MANPNVVFNLRWEECDPDCSECSGCKEVVFGRTFRMVVTSKKTRNCLLVLCNSCYAVVKGS
jgi:hypothetical protein